MKTSICSLIFFFAITIAKGQHYESFYSGAIFTKETREAETNTLTRDAKPGGGSYYKLGNFFVTYGEGYKHNMFFGEAFGAITFNSAMLNINTGIAAPPFDFIAGAAIMVVPGRTWTLNQNVQLFTGLRCTIHKFSVQVSYTDHSWVAGIGAKIFE